MREPFVVDAHAHTGYPGQFFAPEQDATELLRRMDALRIEYSLHCGDMVALAKDEEANLELWQRAYEQSQGRIPFLAVYNPKRPVESLRGLRTALGLSGCRGIKIHPSFHGTSADHPGYDPVWAFAAEHELPIMSHSWSVSGHNPSQALSTPERFEGWVRKYPGVRFVLGHAGGRGTGRFEAFRMAREHPSVYMDFGGDIYCHELVEHACREVPVEKILFGSDWPWLDQRSHLSRVYLARIDPSAKRRILRDNALAVYRLGQR
jgi:predicted TIM-barrel fold metal-dependent hydrolase